nr:DUF1194 domain-containing protein [Microvirga antarctica]
MRLRILPVLAVVMMVMSTVAAKAETEVDLALVLAVDVSRSMDPDEQELQRQGFVEALRSPQVHQAIAGGTLGRIVVSYVEWSGENEQTVIVPWTVLDDEPDAVAFAGRLAAAPVSRMRRTSISGAIDFGVRLLADTGVTPLRKVIDISGDGPNSSGRAVTRARDEAASQGITINGLPIMLKRPSGFGDIDNLDAYYRDCVIGGRGAFIVPVRERQQFAEAIRNKIIREIADLSSTPLIQPAQAASPVDCATRGSAGWDQWRN